MWMTATEVDGRHLRDAAGQTVGRVTAFYYYPDDLNAPWGAVAVISDSLFRSPRLVDLYDARVVGDMLVTDYPLEKIRTAPTTRTDGDTMDKDQATRVLTHYRGTPNRV